MIEVPREVDLPGDAIPEGDQSTAVPPRDAASVVLLRDGEDGPEAFLLRRVHAMAFAGGMTVFPGGGVDSRDTEPIPSWAGPSPRWWADAFGCTPELASALVCAAVRETFEESGVLLAGEDGASVVRDTGRYASQRRALANRELSLARLLSSAGLVLRSDLLRPLANWVTPEGEARRYDARFFLAELPDGQDADGATTEADGAMWQRPADCLASWRAGECALMPPTFTTLAELAEYPNVRATLAADRTLTKVLPKLIRSDGRVRIMLPGSKGYENG